MLLSPKKSNYLKSFAGKHLKHKKNRKSYLNLGQICLVANEPIQLTNFQFESMRLFLRRYLKKSSQMFFPIFPSVPITKKPNEIRLGCGKGPVKYWSFNLKKGDIIVEIRSTSQIKKAIFFLAAARVKIGGKSFVFNKLDR